MMTDRYCLIHGDNIEVLKTMEDNVVDSIVTDPPYGLGKEPDAMKLLSDWITTGHHDVKSKSGFMGKEWDAFVPQPAFWKECYRVLKPGGHILSFGGTRTYDLVTLGLRIAGFEIRDTLMWIYGSGFPKSMDISKAIDKAVGAERTVIGEKKLHSYKTKSQGQDYGNLGYDFDKVNQLTAPATPDAEQWNGWGTALKPAHEPIVMARKPLEGTVSQNVLKWGVGGINVDGCRVDGTVVSNPLVRHSKGYNSDGLIQGVIEGGSVVSNGRFPANVIHDGSDEVIEQFPVTKSGAMKRDADGYDGDSVTGFIRGRSGPTNQHGDSGSAARFFYCAKATRADRDDGLEAFDSKVSINTTGKGLGNTIPSCPEHGAGLPSGSNYYSCGCAQVFDDEQTERRVAYKNNHPTVKPIELMRYLVRMVTPSDGTVLDPFMGSGSTGKACMLEGFNFIGIELDDEYVKIAEARIEHALLSISV